MSALLRRAESIGGFGTVLHKGDAERGALLILLAERGVPAAFLERMLQRDGSYAWELNSGVTEGPDSSTQYVARRQRTDPDCWVIELDVPSAERFIAEMTGSP